MTSKVSNVVTKLKRIQTKIKGRQMKFRELARIFQDAKLTAPVYDAENLDDRRKRKGIVVQGLTIA